MACIWRSSWGQNPASTQTAAVAHLDLLALVLVILLPSATCAGVPEDSAVAHLAPGRSPLVTQPAKSTRLLAHPWVSRGRHLLAEGFGGVTMGGATFGGVIGALEPVDSGMVGLDEKVRLVFPFRPICFFGTGIFPIDSPLDSSQM